MAFKADTGDHEVSRQDLYFVDPRALVVDWRKNLSRGGVKPPVDDELKKLARDMITRKGDNAEGEGSTGQVNPITVRPRPDRKLEVVMGFRRLRAALWLIESGECPDFKIKYIVSRMSDAEAALANFAENLFRSDPTPVQSGYAIRAFVEGYGMSLNTVAKRLKKSVAWCHDMLALLDLPAPILASVQEGETPVTAALELRHIPDAKAQVATFNALRDSKGKVKASDVKDVRKKQAREEGEIVPRNFAETLSIFKEHDADAGPGGEFAKAVIDFATGLITEEEMELRWDQAFNREDDE